MFFLCRFIQPTLGTVTVGLGTATDGIIVTVAPPGVAAQITVAASAANSPSGVAQTRTMSTPIPPMVAGQPYDMGLEIDRMQNLFLYAGTQLVGWLPQSGTGGPFLPDGSPTTVIPTRGKVFANYNYIAQQTGLGTFLNPVMFTTAPVGALVGLTGQVDFVGVFKER
jgi:hypothetical protein